MKSRDRKKRIKSEKSEAEKKRIPKSTKGKSISRSRNSKEKKKEKKNLGKKILTIILAIAIFFVFFAAAFMIYIVISTGSFDPEALKNQDQTVLLDKNGEVFATLGAQKRESVTYDELPQVLIDAIVATEDSRYYQHNGVDMARFLKASVLQLLGNSSAGGASTLTMQVVKNNLTDTSQSIIRKFKDVYLSVFFMEKRYTKEEILEMYVNDSCLGGTIFGVEEASKYYFGKSVSNLSLPEASLLAGMYQAPTRYNPYKNPEAATKRRSTVLSLMVRHGYITEDEKEMAESVSVESLLAGNGKESSYQGYIDTVIEEVEKETGDNPAKVSMKIYTALDRDIQDGINKVLSGEDHTWADDKVQAGIAVTNVNDGTIVAIGSGRNRKSGDWNYATQSYRQPGSTAKPLFDYGPGFEYNDFSTYTLFNDEPWTYTNGPSVGNWDGNYEGLITLRRALSYSRNVPALKAFQTVGSKNITKFVNGLGLDIAYSTKDENYKEYDNGANNLINEAYSIGGMSYGVTPLEMAEAYACFANGGYHIETHAVTKIEYRSTGKTIEFNKDREKVMSDSTAYLMNNVLQYAVEAGFNGGAKVYGSTVAAKTGTSNLPEEITRKYGIPSSAVNDLWTVAYTPEYSIALWYGYDEVDSEHYLSGASAPKDAVMQSVMKYIPKTTKKWEMPSSVVSVTIEKETWPAKLASEYTPDNMKITEYFKKGTQPTEVSERYSKLNAVTNLQSTKTSNGYKLTWNWKVPDILNESYLSKYFSNSVYGNQSATYLKNRLDYNNNTLGGNGFGIYVKDESSGSLERIAFTNDTEYLYKPTKSGNVEIVVKAEYKNFKNNASDEVKITINSDGSQYEDNSSQNEDLEIKLKGTNNTLYKKGNYSEDGITVIYEGKDVTSEAKITYNLNNKTYNSETDLIDNINSLSKGDYTITYNILYKAKKASTTRQITIFEQE
ncbi:MAG: transglycosylase domain-containing protein [Bacilli bacterium]